MSFDISRFKRIALIALALQSTGGIVGRTKFQKIMYLANLCGWNAAEFRYDNFGPYSETLARELEGMRKNGWVEEKVEGTRRDRQLYTYALSRPYRQRAISTIGKLDEMGEGKLIHKTEGLTKVLNKFDSDNLEIMATLVFLSRNDKQLDESDLVNLTHELKPRFSLAQIQKGLRIFKILS